MGLFILKLFNYYYVLLLHGKHFSRDELDLSDPWGVGWLLPCQCHGECYFHWSSPPGVKPQVDWKMKANQLFFFYSISQNISDRLSTNARSFSLVEYPNIPQADSFPFCQLILHNPGFILNEISSHLKTPSILLLL